MALVAALSAGHLGVFTWPPSLRRLYIARDQDGGGDARSNALRPRTSEAGIEPVGLTPTRNGFNDDLRDFGADHLRRLLAIQLAPDDKTTSSPASLDNCSLRSYIRDHISNMVCCMRL